MIKLLPLLLVFSFISCTSIKELTQDTKGKDEEIISEDILVEDEIIEDEKALEILEKENIEVAEFKELIEKPLYEFTPDEVDEYLAFLYNYEPNLRKRVDHLAKKFIGQQYEIYLLGEFPFEIYDPQPLFSLDKSDCVVFSEHVYAMALSDSWKKFFAMLQRIRYKDGIIGILTRNHYTEADWTVNNSWLVKNITDSLPGVESKKVTTKINRAKFFSKYKLGQDIPEEELNWSYIPASEVPKALKYLKTGDFVNVVRGYSPEDVYVGHVGIISVGSDGTVYLIHSAEPEVKIERLVDYMNKSLAINKVREEENRKIIVKNKKIIAYNERLRKKNNGLPHPEEKKLLNLKPIFYGFRFFELQENALENLIQMDGPKAPRVIIYGGD